MLALALTRMWNIKRRNKQQKIEPDKLWIAVRVGGGRC